MAEAVGPHPGDGLDPDETARCPVALWCESCGSPDDLDVGTAESPVGIFCVTLCGSCAEAGSVPTVRSWSAAVRAVMAHAGHLGCTVDDLAPSRP